MLAETQPARIASIKTFLRSRAKVPCDSKSIMRVTGVPKRQIDYQRSLSNDPAILRERFWDPKTRTRRVYWTYVGHEEGKDLPEPDELCFSAWRSWDDRDELKYTKDDLRAGVYLLSRFDTAPRRDLAPTWLSLPSQICYIGMSKNLNNRPLADHVTGKRRYRVNYPLDQGLVNLYVSVCPVFKIGCPDHQLLYAQIQYLEMKLAWRYTSEHGKILHSKNRKPK